MPNPGYAPRLSTLELEDDRWRVALRYDGDSAYVAWMQRRIGGEWRAVGPTARGRSQADVLGALVRGYRDVANAIENMYRFEGVAAIEDGCPQCGYHHPNLSFGGAEAHLSCPVCRIFLVRSVPSDGG